MVRQEFRFIEHARQDAVQPIAAHQRQQAISLQIGFAPIRHEARQIGAMPHKPIHAFTKLRQRCREILMKNFNGE
jgi:hypothetical protein